jgi:hypothetical protein
VSLAPQLGLQEIEVEWLDTIGWPYSIHWLVVCNGILLIIDDPMSIDSGSGVYKVYHLDMSTEHATCVEVVNLENDTLFIGLDARSPPFYCTSPWRWGGRSNCLYCAHYSQPCVSPRLGDVVWVDQNIFNDNIQLRPFWVYPSMLYSDGQWSFYLHVSLCIFYLWDILLNTYDTYLCYFQRVLKFFGLAWYCACFLQLAWDSCMWL